jgi:hypothetical protein
MKHIAISIYDDPYYNFYTRSHFYERTPAFLAHVYYCESTGAFLGFSGLFHLSDSNHGIRDECADV